MKKFIAYLLLLLLPGLKVMSQTKGYVDRNTKEFHLKGNISDNYTIYGYSSPDLKSEKLIKFSLSTSRVKTTEVYKLGSYHETTSLIGGDRIKFVGFKGKFAELNFITSDNTVTPFFIRKKNIDAE